MLDDTNPSMTFSKDEVEDGSIDRASPEALRTLFRRIAEKAAAARTPT
jgi:hypothetical protein